MAKNDAELQALEQPKSRNEEYLNFLCGRAVDINSLPDKPYSRVEHYLEYLCHNGGVGGGGGANPFVGLTNATLNGNIITFNKSDGTTLDVPLTDFIRGELTKVGGDARYEDKIPQLNADGKVDISMIPDLSINKIHSADNEAAANKLIEDGVAQVGDTIIVKDTGSVYLYVNDQGANFGDRTIEIAFANGAVKMVNGQIPNPQGNVNVESQHIPYDKNTSNLNSTDVQGAIDELVTKINNTFNDAVYTVNDQKITLTRVDGNTQDVLLNDLASKTLDNTFTGNNTFKDINLGLPIKINENQNVQGGSWTTAHYEIKTGNRNVTSHLQNSNGYVRNLVIRVGGVAIGDKVNVNVWEVKKGQNRNGDTPTQLHSNLELTTVEPSGYFNGGVAVKIPINKKYSDETYFIYQVVGTARIFRVSGANASEDYILLLPDVDVTRDNIVASPQDSVGAHILELGDVSIGYLLGNTTSGTVTSVNNIKPVDGNVTVKSVNIEYDNANSNLLSTDVQSAIDELKDDMSLINGAEIFILADKTELDDFLNNPNTLEHGDLIYIIDSTDVVDFDNKPVDGGNPIAMIYDVTVGGNGLRVFSKFSSTTHITASNVEYDDKTTNLGAKDVQGAIKALNDKIGTTTSGVTSVVFDGVDKLNVVTNGQSVSQDLSPLLGIKTINGQVGTSGAINLSINNTTNRAEFKVDNHTFATLDYMTEQDANDIIDSFDL